MIFYIRRGVYFVPAGDAIVFLDLPSDRYSMLVGEKARLFRAMTSSARDSIVQIAAPTSRHQESASNLIDELLTDLHETRLLTHTIHEAAPTCSKIELPSADLCSLRKQDAGKIGAYDVLTFAKSCLMTTARLQYASIESTVKSVRRRKPRAFSLGDSDVGELRRLTALYKTLRPCFPRDFLCLFDSLSLIDFLAAHRFFPDLIFAVRLDPWSAHCWVQYGTLALNQDFVEASDYVPIMAV